MSKISNKQRYTQLKNWLSTIPKKKRKHSDNIFKVKYR